jgi:hypothetical protein
MSVPHASLFSQLLGEVDRKLFQRLVRQTGSEKRAKGFASWDQFVSMMFCQLAQAKSLREIETGLRACEGKLRHLGMAKAPGRSTLSYANAHRPWNLYEQVFHALLSRCQEMAPGKKFRFKNKLYSMDATVVELCASMFDWATYRKAKGAVKLHLLLDHDGYLPVFAHITEGRVADVKFAQALDLPKGSIVAMDRGYIDYRLFERWSKKGVFFVTRGKKNADIYVVDKLEVPAGSNVTSDEIVEFNVFQAGRTIKGQYRRVKVWIEEKGKTLVLLTNNFKLAASTIASIYKERWQIELFFKALKQNLRIKTFVGTSANAVHIQIWTALISMLLLKMVQFRSKLGWALSNLVALLRWNLFTHRDLWRWIDDPFDSLANPPPDDQLGLNLDSMSKIRET